ncbi:RNA 2',3'-cyclic phosphodiesterase [Halopseudomonas phragmitis]|uniref:RNA 2',3'-cyclic phosphodiesterase n=2 Tax=Pseudomonadaceae TaxID=135621 RepID=A0A1V0B0Y2_9GAMM|nr:MULTISPECIES: RNA 2',3'-cyclic phosphodiesterase [Pseudomonadaceae]AQZ93607.1 2'-5' RNA ligase [Halopseudomonas phragmitis]RHW20265.1 RNA 2',3'-cyclic phosphodiesterase [Pseudomonas jilinensis]
MPRLFIALELPEPVKQALLQLAEPMPGARWQSAEQLHLTLRFVGEVAAGQVEQVIAALTSLRFRDFTLTVKGMGWFGPPRRPLALWAGVSPQAPLRRLKQQLDHLLAEAGIGPDRQGYKPHITLARLHGPQPGPEDYVQRHKDLRGPCFRVEHVSLFLSDLSEQGASYRVLGRYPCVEE